MNPVLITLSCCYVPYVWSPVSAADVQGMFILSDLWGMACVRAACVKFMELELDASNCLGKLLLGFI